jgi:dihydroorotate dehydrogenase (NAD+) catalytic subunit
VSAVRKATSLFVTVKLSPHSDLSEVARACSEAGCDSVTLINTLPGMAVDVVTRRPWLGNITGGLSGPAIRPVAIYWVYRITRELKIPAIGVGGIMRTEDAVEFMIAGASAIQIGTANFVDPTTPLRVIDGIASYCEREGVDRLSDLVGALDLEELPDRDQAAEQTQY